MKKTLEDIKNYFESNSKYKLEIKNTYIDFGQNWIADTLVTTNLVNNQCQIIAPGYINKLSTNELTDDDIIKIFDNFIKYNFEVMNI